MNNLNSETSLARDKIAQVYLGEWGSEAFQKRTRDRINWFVDQIDHGTILDIGCSEGILPILLGRKGINVIGVDINPDSIEYARNLLAKEKPSVSDYVTFICDDFIKSDWSTNKYDTVIIGEIIEHFSNPEIIIDKAISQLKPGAFLYITTPFGYLPDPDHRITFTLSSFLDIFKKPNITPLSLSVVDGYIRFSARNAPAEPDQWEKIAQNLIIPTEKGLLDEQKKFYAQLNEMAILRQKLYATIKSLKEQKTEIANDLIKLTDELKQLNDKFKSILVENQTLEAQYEILQAARKEIEIQYESLRTVNKELVTSNSKLKNLHDNLEMEINTITSTLSYQVCHEIAIAINPLRFSSLLLPITLVKLVINWRKHKT